MPEQGVREIQLTAKQLVFLFMAATVAGVVIFLLGVMVGRDLPRSAALADVSARAASDPTIDGLRARPVGATRRGSNTLPLSAQETLTYAERLESPGPPPETLSEPILPSPAPHPEPMPFMPAAAGELALAPEAAARAEAPARPASQAELAQTGARSEPARTTPSQPGRVRESSAETMLERQEESPGSGFVVQVAAYRQRSEADAMARRLAASGYPSFVTVATATGDAPRAFYRVRVGTYGSRGEAEAVASRLEREGPFRPWITR